MKNIDYLDKYRDQLKGSYMNHDVLTEEVSADDLIKKENRKEAKKEIKERIQLRKKSFNFVKILIMIQLIIFDVIVIFILCSVSLNCTLFKNLDIKVVENLLDFLKYYIGATIVELLGMFGFILSFAFPKKKGS